MTIPPVEIGDIYEGDMYRYYLVLSQEQCRKYRLCVRDIQGDTIFYDSYGLYTDGSIELIKSSRNPNGELKKTTRNMIEGEIAIGKLVKVIE